MERFKLVRYRNNECVPTRYKEGDIVWVKLNSVELWWPGRIACPEDKCYLSTCTEPYATVVFFSEKTYELVSKPSLIYPFQCARKSDFVDLVDNKKNMKDHKKRQFYQDVKTAEILYAAKMAKESGVAIVGPPETLIQARLTNNSSSNSNNNNNNNNDNNGYGLRNNTRHQKSSTVTSATTSGSVNIWETRTQTTLNNTATRRHRDSTIRIMNIGESRTDEQESLFYTCDHCDFRARSINVLVLHRNTHLEQLGTVHRQTVNPLARTRHQQQFYASRGVRRTSARTMSRNSAGRAAARAAAHTTARNAARTSGRGRHTTQSISGETITSLYRCHSRHVSIVVDATLTDEGQRQVASIAQRTLVSIERVVKPNGRHTMLAEMEGMDGMSTCSGNSGASTPQPNNIRKRMRATMPAPPAAKQRRITRSAMRQMERERSPSNYSNNNSSLDRSQTVETPVLRVATNRRSGAGRRPVVDRRCTMTAVTAQQKRHSHANVKKCDNLNRRQTVALSLPAKQMKHAAKSSKTHLHHLALATSTPKKPQRRSRMARQRTLAMRIGDTDAEEENSEGEGEEESEQETELEADTNSNSNNTGTDFAASASLSLHQSLLAEWSGDELEELMPPPSHMNGKELAVAESKAKVQQWQLDTKKKKAQQKKEDEQIADKEQDDNDGNDVNDSEEVEQDITDNANDESSSAATPLTAVSANTTDEHNVRNIPKKDRLDMTLQEEAEEFSMNGVGRAARANDDLIVIGDSDASSNGSVVFVDTGARTASASNPTPAATTNATISTAAAAATKCVPTAGTGGKKSSCFDFAEDEEEEELAGRQPVATPTDGQNGLLSYRRHNSKRAPDLSLANGASERKNNLSPIEAEGLSVSSDESLKGFSEDIYAMQQAAAIESAHTDLETLQAADLEPLKDRQKRIFKSRNKSQQATTQRDDIEDEHQTEELDHREPELKLKPMQPKQLEVAVVAVAEIAKPPAAAIPTSAAKVVEDSILPELQLLSHMTPTDKKKKKLKKKSERQQSRKIELDEGKTKSISKLKTKTKTKSIQRKPETPTITKPQLLEEAEEINRGNITLVKMQSLMEPQKASIVLPKPQGAEEEQEDLTLTESATIPEPQSPDQIEDRGNVSSITLVNKQMLMEPQKVESIASPEQDEDRGNNNMLWLQHTESIGRNESKNEEEGEPQTSLPELDGHVSPTLSIKSNNSLFSDISSTSNLSFKSNTSNKHNNNIKDNPINNPAINEEDNNSNSSYHSNSSSFISNIAVVAAEEERELQRSAQALTEDSNASDHVIILENILLPTLYKPSPIPAPPSSFDDDNHSTDNIKCNRKRSRTSSTSSSSSSSSNNDSDTSGNSQINAAVQQLKMTPVVATPTLQQHQQQRQLQQHQQQQSYLSSSSDEDDEPHLQITTAIVHQSNGDPSSSSSSSSSRSRSPYSDWDRMEHANREPTVPPLPREALLSKNELELLRQYEEDLATGRNVEKMRQARERWARNRSQPQNSEDMKEKERQRKQEEERERMKKEERERKEEQAEQERNMVKEERERKEEEEDRERKEEERQMEQKREKELSLKQEREKKGLLEQEQTRLRELEREQERKNELEREQERQKTRELEHERKREKEREQERQRKREQEREHEKERKKEQEQQEKKEQELERKRKQEEERKSEWEREKRVGQEQERKKIQEQERKIELQKRREQEQERRKEQEQEKAKETDLLLQIEMEQMLDQERVPDRDLTIKRASSEQPGGGMMILLSPSGEHHHQRSGSMSIRSSEAAYTLRDEDVMRAREQLKLLRDHQLQQQQEQLTQILRRRRSSSETRRRRSARSAASSPDADSPEHVQVQGLPLELQLEQLHEAVTEDEDDQQPPRTCAEQLEIEEAPQMQFHMQLQHLHELQHPTASTSTSAVLQNNDEGNANTPSSSRGGPGGRSSDGGGGGRRIKLPGREGTTPEARICAVMTRPIPGYTNTFMLCSLGNNNNFTPINNEALYLDSENHLVPVPLEALTESPTLPDGNPASAVFLLPNQLPGTLLTAEQQQILMDQSGGIEIFNRFSELNQQVTDDDGNEVEVGPFSDENLEDIEMTVDDDVGVVGEEQEVEMGPSEMLQLQMEVLQLNVNGHQLELSTDMLMNIMQQRDDIVIEIDGRTAILPASEIVQAAKTYLQERDLQLVNVNNMDVDFVPEDDDDDDDGDDDDNDGSGDNDDNNAAPANDLLAAALAGTDVLDVSNPSVSLLHIDTRQQAELGMSMGVDVNVGVGMGQHVADGSVVDFLGQALNQAGVATHHHHHHHHHHQQQQQQHHHHLTSPISTSTNETNALLDQTPIMSTLESPSRGLQMRRVVTPLDESNLEHSLAVIGVTTNGGGSGVPTSLELPITVTNPAIASRPSGVNDMVKFVTNQ